MSTYGLAIHTASSALGLALSNGAGDDRAQVWELGRETSNLLHQYLLDFLQPQTWSDLGFIAVAKGPGGFTGTRIGVVTARTLAQQLELPLFAVSTLAGVAWRSAKSLERPIEIAVQMPAQRGETFGAIYRVASTGLTAVVPDAVMPLEQWQELVRDRLHVIEATDIAASVVEILELAYLEWQQGDRPHWSEALPFYGQHPIK